MPGVLLVASQSGSLSLVDLHAKPEKLMQHNDLIMQTPSFESMGSKTWEATSDLPSYSNHPNVRDALK